MFATSVLRPLGRKPKAQHDCQHTGALHQLLARMTAQLGEWRRRLRDRRALAVMSDRSLRDIGLTRYDALYEADKPFWRE